ncbi:MAG: GNAT family N-acetyltransferase, partial [Abditibacteriales bacterium]|nr:GNAT family N-acetyltransferase [Abditibacteriales bacterium]
AGWHVATCQPAHLPTSPFSPLDAFAFPPMNLLAAWRKVIEVSHRVRPMFNGATPVAPAVWQQGDLVLRRFSFAHDADVVCSFQYDTYTLNFPGFVVDKRFLNAFRHDLRRAVDDPMHGVFVLEQGGRIVGFLWVVAYENGWTGERYGYVNNVYVIPEARGQGLGRLMMEFTEQHFRQRGITRIRLTVTASNEAAVNLYKSQGYITARYEMEKNI